MSWIKVDRLYLFMLQAQTCHSEHWTMYGFTRTRHTGRVNSIAKRGAKFAKMRSHSISCLACTLVDFACAIESAVWFFFPDFRLFSFSSQQGRLSNSSGWFLMSKRRRRKILLFFFAFSLLLLPKISFLFLRSEKEHQEKCRSFDFPSFSIAN